MGFDDFSASSYNSSLLTGPVSGGRRRRKTGKKCATSKTDIKKMRRHTKKVHKAYKNFLKMVKKLPIKKRRKYGGGGDGEEIFGEGSEGGEGKNFTAPM
jgi:hypothetical protein